MTTTVLLTHGFSYIHSILNLIRSAMPPGEFRLLASYRSEHSAIQTAADVYLHEPEHATDAAYLDWLRGVCRAHGVDLLWPQSRLKTLLAHRAELEAAGLKLLLPCPDLPTLSVIDDKTQSAAVLAGAVALPRWRLFHDSAELDAALADLAECAQVCVKPAVSVYGHGFRLLDEARTPWQRFLHNDTFSITRAELHALLAANHDRRAFLAMEYLAGEERSLDCLAVQGELVQAVVRKKARAARDRWQWLDADPEGLAIAATVCAQFRLHGLVNIQTRERLHPDGTAEQCFLEVNPRMSGGIALACAGGLNLPYWALRLALGTATPAAVPPSATGLRVAKTEGALALP